MRSAEQIVQAAIGNPEFELPAAAVKAQEGPFEVVEFQLPPRPFYGVPPVWRFAIFKLSTSPLNAAERAELVRHAREMVRTYPKTNETKPLVIISDDPTINLRQNLDQTHPRVFFLESGEIRSLKRPIDLAPFTPIIMAVRGRLSSYDTVMNLSPYVPGRPATSWRFYGRRRELQRLEGSSENIIVVGPRQIGKTSLLLELERRLLARGYKAFFIDVQDLIDEKQLRQRILEKLSLRDAAAIMHRRELSQERVLFSFLKRISSLGDVVLLIDELGNVVKQMKGEDWKILGILRQFAHSGRLRIIASSFQEFQVKEQEDFSGPWVNFAVPLRLGGLNKEDVVEFVINPLSTWRAIGNPNELATLALTEVGTHPLLLQHFGRALFEEIAGVKGREVLAAARGILDDRTRLVSIYDEAVRSMFYRMPSSMLRYVFLLACQERKREKGSVFHARIDERWLGESLRSMGFLSTVTGRRRILEELEVRGLTEAVEGNHGVQRVVTPIVFTYVCAVEADVDGLIAEFKSEIPLEASRWELRPLTPPASAATEELAASRTATGSG